MRQHERPTLARRGFLRGLSALPVAAAVTAPVMPASAAEAVSPEVAELSRLFDTARRRTLAAHAACEAAEARMIRPAAPEALFQQPDDPLHGCFTATRIGDRFWYGSPHSLDMLRGWNLDHLAAAGWGKRIARRNEVLATNAQWEADFQAARDAAGVTAADAEYSAAWREDEVPVRERILALRSTEPAALALKVRVFMASVAAEDWRTELDEKISAAVEEEGGPWEDAFAASILRDLVTAHAA